MSADPGQRAMECLDGIAAGDPNSSRDLATLLYDELRLLARRRLARESDWFGDPTSLVHETYLRLVGGRELQWNGRAHFFGAAARAMRRIIVERARRRDRSRHGGDLRRVTLDEDALGEEPAPESLIALDRALTRLEAIDPVMAQVVNLRFFAGLTIPEIADAVATSPRSVDRLWSRARAWIHRDMS